MPHHTTAAQSRRAGCAAAALAAAVLLPGCVTAAQSQRATLPATQARQVHGTADSMRSTGGPQRTLAADYDDSYGYDYSWWDYAAQTNKEEAEAECTVFAATQEVAVSGCGNLHARAIVELFETVCSTPDSVTLEKIEEVFLQRDAVAFAQATAAAIVDCTSTNEDAYLCASVTASAQAFAQTTVRAHVDAMASVVRGCGCQDEVTAFGSSEVFIALVAEATATATASACIQGTGRVVSSAYDSCTSKVYARVFARAAAQAIIEGSCLNGEAAAALLLEADAMDVTAGSTCGGIAAVTVTSSPGGQ